MAYNIFDDMAFYNLASDAYTQTPACDYTYSGAYTWSGTNTYIK